jgi:enterochelin esterase-like enzyme
MQSDYWIYVPAQYDPRTPAALMVWQDGHFYNDRDSPTLRVLDVIDNLTHQKRIPVMIQVFTSPGDISSSEGTPTHAFVKAFAEATGRTLQDAMRSTLYDTVSDRYACFLRDELLAEVQSKYNIRRDGYSRGISGLSSGAICAFNVAWWQPDQFSRVLSWIGSYGDIQGGHEYPFKVRKEEKRNIRVWLQDGSEDLEVVFGSWPLQNIQMANSLKMREYDFHFSFGQGGHDSLHGSAELPQSLAWLWRGYDPAKTEQAYEMEEAEKSQPYFRVRIANRE